MQTRRVRVPTVALVGRTNVGKSTLFNRLLEEERAIVSAKAGTTRDRSYAVSRWRGRDVQIVDTGGLDAGRAEELERDVVLQAKVAIAEADVILFIVDLATGALPQDKTLANALAVGARPVFLVGNKADNPRIRARADDREWAALRLGAMHPVSAKNGGGIGDLLDAVLATLAETGPTEEPETKIAILGRPNVGKSSLLNRLCREDRVIVSPIPGTTREPTDTLIDVDGHRYLLVDTVGLRRHARRAETLEFVGAKKTEKAIERAEVLFLIVDLAEPITAQDRVLAGMAEDSGKAVVLVGNKWDLLPAKTAQTLFETEADVHRALPFFDFAPLRIVSAKTGVRVDDLLEDARRAKARWQTRIDEKALDAFFRRTIVRAAKGKNRPFVYRMKQTGAEPPSFLLSVRGKEPVPYAFLRFIEKRLREKFDFTGTPIRVRGKPVQVKPS